MGSITLEAVEKWFGDVQVIRGIDLKIHDGEMVIFVGPSGCGKSTLLRMIAGLEDTSRGRILLDGEDVTAKMPGERGLSMVFQSYALYPHMNVRENVAFGLKTAGEPKAEIERKVSEAARVLELEPYLDRRPKDLSGGQRQRVAIGRAIVREPKGFLFDEPLSNLDAALRVQMRFEIARLHDRLSTTMIYVTHDQVEAMTLADRIVVLRNGEVMQVGAPRELYERPDNLFVAQFIGSPQMNVVAADGVRSLTTDANVAHLGIRPEHVSIVEGDVEAHARGIVDIVEYLGADTFVYIQCPELGLVTVRTHDVGAGLKGREVGLRFDPAHTHLFGKDERRL